MKDYEKRILLMCSFRYILGRKSYIVGQVIDLIRDNKDCLDREDLKTFIDEITHYQVSLDMKHSEFNNFKHWCEDMYYEGD